MSQGNWITNPFGVNFDTNPYGAMNPDQEALSQQLGPDYQSILSQGPSAFEYGGNMTAPITPGMQSIVDQNQANVAPANQMYSGLMNNANPNQVNQWYDQYVQGPEQQNFQTNVAPYLREQAPGFGTAGEATVGQSENTLQNNLMAGRLAALQQGQQTGLQAAQDQTANNANQLSIAQVPYNIQQAGLTNEYNNFYNSSQEYQQSLNAMNQFLGISSGTTTQNPSPIQQGLAAAGSAAQIYAAIQSGGASSALTSALNATNNGSNSGSGSGSTSSDYSLQGSPLYASALSGNYGNSSAQSY